MFNIHIRSFLRVAAHVFTKVTLCRELTTAHAERTLEHAARVYAHVSIQPVQQFHNLNSL